MEQNRRKVRRILVNGKWVEAGKSLEDMETLVSGLTDTQRHVLSRRVTHPQTGLSPDNLKVWDDIKDDVALFLVAVQNVKASEMSTMRNDLKYTVTTDSYAYGTCTKLSDKINACYTWGVQHDKADKPDVIGVVAELAASFGKPTEAGPVAETFAKSQIASAYFPKRNLLGGVISGLVEKPTTHDTLVAAIRPHVGHDSLGREQVIEDLVACQPAALKLNGGKGVRKIAVGAKTLLVKAPPLKVQKLPIPYTHAVEAVSVMTSALGSRKYGFGRMSESHYDGIGSLDGAMRDRHEWLTDFIYQDADVYLLRTRDQGIALAMQRVIAKNHPDEFAVVYESAQCDYKTLREVFTYDDSGTIDGVSATGIVGIGSMMWDRFACVKTYYINFRAYTKGRGHKSELVSSSIDQRRTEAEVAKNHDCWFYYGFVGAMEEDSKVYPSCRGRKGDVIFTNRGMYGRQEMILIVFNCVRHALLYPWLHSCFRYKVKDKYFYDGVRESLDEYDFTRLTGKSGIRTDFSAFEVAPDAIDAIYAMMQNRSKIDGTSRFMNTSNSRKLVPQLASTPSRDEEEEERPERPEGSSADAELVAELAGILSNGD